MRFNLNVTDLIVKTASQHAKSGILPFMAGMFFYHCFGE
jgi:hypothetical protein